MSTVELERVLVVKTELFHSLGYFQGFSTEVEKYFGTLLDPQNTSFRPRGEMEEDPSFKQLIPYVIFRYTDPTGNVHVFQYLRGAGQGEKRLHQKRSIGIGGHISSVDANESNVYAEGMRRELEEEVDIKTSYTDQVAGILNDDETEVGKVHLGVVHIADVLAPEVFPKEDEICEAGFWPIEKLLELDRQSTADGNPAFESWSSISLQALFAK